MSDDLPDRPSPAPARRQLRAEPELRVALARWLEGQGIRLAGRVVCVAGEPDLVTAARDAIYEVKLHLTRKALQQALGQIVLYRQAINPKARAVIVGYATPDTIALQPLLKAFEVEVLAWDDVVAGGWSLVAGEEETHAPSLPMGAEARPNPALPAPVAAQPPVTSNQHLRWNVASVARARGIPNASALATHMNMARQGLYVIWNGTAAQVSLDILGKLARSLEADPGDWFEWGLGGGDWGVGGEPQSPPPSPQSLHWRVRERAEAVGVRIMALGFATGLHQRSLVPIWRGEAQGAGLETLGRLAQALDRPERPFQVGELFAWQASTGDV